jgi:hypothetical protein
MFFSKKDKKDKGVDILNASSSFSSFGDDLNFDDISYSSDVSYAGGRSSNDKNFFVPKLPMDWFGNKSSIDNYHEDKQRRINDLMDGLSANAPYKYDSDPEDCKVKSLMDTLSVIAPHKAESKGWYNKDNNQDKDDKVRGLMDTLSLHAPIQKTSEEDLKDRKVKGVLDALSSNAPVVAQEKSVQKMPLVLLRDDFSSKVGSYLTPINEDVSYFGFINDSKAGSKNESKYKSQLVCMEDVSDLYNSDISASGIARDPSPVWKSGFAFINKNEQKDNSDSTNEKSGFSFID